MRLPPEPKILIIRYDRMGDCLVSTPALQALRQHYPKAHITVFVSPINHKVLAHSPWVDALIICPHKKTWRDKYAFYQKLRQLNPDCILILSPGIWSFIASRLTPQCYRIGMGKSQRFFKKWLQRRCMDHYVDYGQPAHTHHILNDKHHTLSALQCLKPLGISALSPTPLSLSLSPQAHNTWQPLFSQLCGTNTPILGLHVDHKWEALGWQPDDWKMLLHALCKITKTLVITTDRTSTCYKHVCAIAQTHHTTSTPSINYLHAPPCAQTKAGQILCFPDLAFTPWATLIAQCHTWITAEGGSKHVACAMRTPVVNLIPIHLQSQTTAPPPHNSANFEARVDQCITHLPHVSQCEYFQTLNEWYPWQIAHRNAPLMAPSHTMMRTIVLGTTTLLNEASASTLKPTTIQKSSTQPAQTSKLRA